MTDLSELIERVRQNRRQDNALDIEIDIALFEPDRDHVSVRANRAGTKLVYTRHDGRTDTFLARDHTLNAQRRSKAITALQSLKDKS